MASESSNVGYSNNALFGKVYPNTPVLPKASSPGSLLVNVSNAGRNTCAAAKEDPKTCGGKKIKKRELRIGMGGFKHGGRNWRHWKCITPAFIDNMKTTYPTPDSLPGFLDLSSLHQTRVRATYKSPDPSQGKDTQVTRRSARLAKPN